MYVQANGNPVIGRKAKLSTHFSQRDNAIKHTLYKILPMIITSFNIIVYYHDFNYLKKNPYNHAKTKNENIYPMSTTYRFLFVCLIFQFQYSRQISSEF